MGRQRRRFSADFKARVALEAIREQHTVNELASEYGVHPNLIREWKKHLLSELPQVFNSRKGDEQKTLEEERDRLFQQIGQLQYELAWLKKSWCGPLSRSVRLSMWTSPPERAEPMQVAGVESRQLALSIGGRARRESAVHAPIG